MRQMICLVISSVLISGCATARSIEKNYSKINYPDGVNKTEAKLIAKKNLKDSEYKQLYRIIRPQILDNQNTFPHQQHWFVSFSRKSLGVRKSKYLVVVDKKTGEVIYSEKQYPANVLDYAGYRWIFGLEQGNEG